MSKRKPSNENILRSPSIKEIAGQDGTKSTTASSFGEIQEL